MSVYTKVILLQGAMAVIIFLLMGGIYFYYNSAHTSATNEYIWADFKNIPNKENPIKKMKVNKKYD